MATEPESESEPMMIPTAPPPDGEEDSNEPPASTPYIAEDDAAKVQGYGGNESQSEEPNSPLIPADDSSSPVAESGTIQIDLNKRETRLTLWAVAYFIFCICEFTANNVQANTSSSSYSSKLKSAYQTWATSDFFLLIAATLLFIECNPIYILNDITGNMNKDKVHKILRYIICGLFILGGFLRWIALGTHNDVMCNDSRCDSWHFAQDFMATWFSFVIAVETLDVLALINTDQRCLRMVIYCSLLILMSMIVFSDLDYSRRQYNGTTDHCETCYWGYSEAGWFLVLFTLIIILIIVVLVMIHKYDGFMNNDKLRKYAHFVIVVVLHIGVGLMYYSAAILSQTLLGIVAIFMVSFDFLSLS